MSNLAEWDQAAQAASTITTAELDEWAKKLQEAEAEYERAKEISSALYVKYQEIEGKFIEAMDLAGKNKYHVEGIGTFGFRNKYSYQTPKTIEEKQAFAKYLEEHGGKILFWQTFGVNSQTLNSMCNKDAEEFAERVERGEIAPGTQFFIPGVPAPTAKRSLALTKEKAKK